MAYCMEPVPYPAVLTTGYPALRLLFFLFISIPRGMELEWNMCVLLFHAEASSTDGIYCFFGEQAPQNRIILVLLRREGVI